MEQYKKDFIEFMVCSKVLTFGDFITKSGRKTPFFINTGNYETGEQLDKLGYFYATALTEQLGKNFDVLFGPAYKGIPLVVAVSIALSRNFGFNPAFCFNRKEAKDHGEGGMLIGHKPTGTQRVVIVEDVITAGTSIRETLPILRAVAPDIRICGLIVSVDRMEKGTGQLSALDEIRQTLSIPAFSLVTIDEVVEHLYKRKIGETEIITEELKKRIEAYRKEYGC